MTEATNKATVSEFTKPEKRICFNLNDKKTFIDERFQSVTQAYSEKRNRSSLNRRGTDFRGS